jgi:hypothetical protein
MVLREDRMGQTWLVPPALGDDIAAQGVNRRKKSIRSAKSRNNFLATLNTI